MTRASAEGGAPERKIITSRNRASLWPSLDWVACFDDDEPDDHGNMNVGYGPTEQAAINDLLEDE